MEKKIAELIKLYESVIHGSDNKYGLFDCYDVYYKGCWDDDLEKIEKLKKELMG